MSIVEILENAREALIEQGHTKLALIDYDGHVCVYGALLGCTLDNVMGALKTERDSEHRKQVSRALGLLNELAPDYCAITWNNLPETTPGEVIDLVDRGIILAKERGLD